jgi:hypothetical protein
MNIAAARFTPHGMTISCMNRTADPRHDGATCRHAQIRSN